MADDYITLAWLREQGACKEGLEWLAKTVKHEHPHGIVFAGLIGDGHPGHETFQRFMDQADRYGSTARWPLPAVVEALRKAGKTDWLRWFSDRDPRVKETLEPKREGFDPKQLAVGDIFDDTEGNKVPRTVTSVHHDGILISYDNGDHQFYHFSCNFADPITRVIRDGVQIFPPEPKFKVGDRVFSRGYANDVKRIQSVEWRDDQDKYNGWWYTVGERGWTGSAECNLEIAPEPEWTPQVGLWVLYCGTPYRVTRISSEGEYTIAYGNGEIYATVSLWALKPCSAPIDEIAKIIAKAHGVGDAYPGATHSAEKLADEYLIIRKDKP